jgi:hypothetical protein
MDRSRPHRLSVIGLAAILGGALLLRCSYIAQVFLQGVILPVGPDSFYHLWRVEAAVRSWIPPRFDPFVNAPDGAAVIYPDGFDLLLALPGRLLFGGDATRHEIQTVTMVLLPLLGLAAIICVYAIARRVTTRGGALLAAAVAAALPTFIWSSVLGRVDHHVFEMVLPPLALAVLMGATSAGASLKRQVLLSLSVGALVASLIYMVPSALLHIGVLVASIAATAIFRNVDSLLRNGTIALVAAALLVLPDAATRDGLTFFRPSWLGPLTLSFAAAGLGCLALCAASGRRWLLRGAALALIGAGTVAVWLTGGLSFVGRSGVIALLFESQPVWRVPGLALELNTAAYPLLPVMFLWLMRKPQPMSFALGLMGLLGFGLSAVQIRFSVVVALPAAVAMGACCLWAWHQLRILRWRIALVVGVLGVFWPSAAFLAQVKLLGPTEAGLLEVSTWLLKNSPEAGDRGGSGDTRYTLLSDWGVGNQLAYLARRPVVAGAMYHGDYEKGFKDAAALLHGDGNDAPLARRQVRYIVLNATGRATRDAQRRLLGLGRPGRPTLFEHLFDHDGRRLFGRQTGEAHVVRSRGTLRLAYETTITLPVSKEPAFKVFERVKGAALTGRCNAAVRATIAVTTSRGRSFPFVGVSPCVDGRFRLSLPYWGIVTLESLTEGRRHVALSERDVRNGNLIHVRN